MRTTGYLSVKQKLKKSMKTKSETTKGSFTERSIYVPPKFLLFSRNNYEIFKEKIRFRIHSSSFSYLSITFYRMDRQLWRKPVKSLTDDVHRRALFLSRDGQGFSRCIIPVIVVNRTSTYQIPKYLCKARYTTKARCSFI